MARWLPTQWLCLVDATRAAHSSLPLEPARSLVSGFPAGKIWKLRYKRGSLFPRSSRECQIERDSSLRMAGDVLTRDHSTPPLGRSTAQTVGKNLHTHHRSSRER